MGCDRSFKSLRMRFAEDFFARPHSSQRRAPANCTESCDTRLTVVTRAFALKFRFLSIQSHLKRLSAIVKMRQMAIFQ